MSFEDKYNLGGVRLFYDNAESEGLRDNDGFTRRAWSSAFATRASTASVTAVVLDVHGQVRGCKGGLHRGIRRILGHNISIVFS